MLDVEPRHLDEIRRILAARAPGLEVRAFGSRAKGRPKPYSDLDLAVVGIEDRGPDALRLLREAFEESELPFRVDVVDWMSVSEGFRRAIADDCLVIQSAAASSDKP